METISLKELEELREVASRAVRSGMDVVRDWRDRGEDLGVRVVPAASLYDQYVTAVDDAAGVSVVGVLRNADLGARVLGDLSDGDTRTGRVWVVDPVDGTTNLVVGDSFVGVTVALLVNGQLLVGATGCPFTGELWSAAQGLGAHDRSGRRLRLVEHSRDARRIAFDPAAPPSSQRAFWDAARARVAGVCTEVTPRASIALALAYVAEGSFDGFVQIGGSPVQDFAAGALLIREAGGLATGLDGCLDVWRSDVVVAGTRQTHRDLRAALHGLDD